LYIWLGWEIFFYNFSGIFLDEFSILQSRNFFWLILVKKNFKGVGAKKGQGDAMAGGIAAIINRNFSAGSQCIPNDTKVTLIKDESDIKVFFFKWKIDL
jgi:hypothetical protein